MAKKVQTIEQYEAKINKGAHPEVAGANIKVKALRDFAIDRKDAEGKIKSFIVSPGQEALLTEEEAKEVCDREFEGYMPFYGYAPAFAGMLSDDGRDPLARQKIVRGVRVAA